MVKERSRLYHKRKSTRHFLHSKAQAEDRGKKRTRIPGGTIKVLQSVYPGLPSGRAFLNQAAEQLSTAAVFTCLVFRIDAENSSGPALLKSDPANIYQEAAKLFDDFCKKNEGIWGLVHSGLFGAFFKGKNGSQCLAVIQHFQKKLKKHYNITVSAGIAEYPTLDYQPSEIFTNAQKALDHAAFFGPSSAMIFDAVSLNISGDKLFEKGDIEGSIEEFEQALKLDPSNINVHNSLGVCYGLTGDYEKAKLEFQSALKLNSNEVMPWYNLGFTSMLNGNRNKALDLFLKANTINQDVFEVAFQTGRLLLDIGQPESGKNFLRHAARLKPKSGAAFRYLGDCYTNIGDIDAAIAAYKKAIKRNPSDAASLSAMGCLFDQQEENPDIALMFCQESVQLSPENGVFRYRLGRLYLKQNRLNDALREFKKAAFLGQDASEYISQIQRQLFKAS